jgi:hypothetical protein
MVNFQGLLVILLCLLPLGLLLLTNIHSFLAITASIDKADALVIDGWLPDYAIEQAVIEFHRGAYKRLITVGPPLTHGRYLFEYKSYAELAAATVIALGVPPEAVITLPVHQVGQDRTLTAFRSFYDWLSTEAPEIKSANLCTLGPHARRSWLLLKQALSPQIKVGVIAIQPQGYDPHRWWKYSAGARSVITEAIGYIYILVRSLLPALHAGSSAPDF